MAWFNVIVILLLAKPGIRTLRDYEEQKKMGLDPVFVPERLGIHGAELWDTIVARTYPKQLAALKEKEKRTASRGPGNGTQSTQRPLFGSRSSRSSR